MKTYSLFIGGEDVESDRCDYSANAEDLMLRPIDTIKTLSRLKKEGSIGEDGHKILGKFYLAGEQEIERAIDSAYLGFQALKKTSIDDRVQILYEVHRKLSKRKKEFVDLLIAEGHPRRLAEWQLDNLMFGTSHENVKFYKSLTSKKFKVSTEEIRLINKPDGVILVIPPRNAPASNSLVALSALLNGSALIIKPPQKLPISTIFLWREIVVKALESKGMPKDIINIIQGNSSVILEKCLNSRKVSTVFIFGESKQGIDLGKKVYMKGKKPILELSGNDPMMIWKDAKINDGLVESALEAFLGSTQICMVPKMFFIHHAIYNRFSENMLRRVSQVKPGLPGDKNTWLSPVGKMKEFFECLNDALSKGAKLLCGGKAIDIEGNEDAKGMFLQPTLIEINDVESLRSMLCFKNEIFFPLVPFVKVGSPTLSDEEVARQMIDLIEANTYGLRVSIWIRDNIFKQMFINEINNCGTIRINSRHIGFSRYLSTHGGTGLTGGPTGELNYMCLRAGHLQGISIIKQ